jgi:hypothetical protein
MYTTAWSFVQAMAGWDRHLGFGDPNSGFVAGQFALSPACCHQGTRIDSAEEAVYSMDRRRQFYGN